MISNISSKLVSINEDNLYERLTSILKELGSYYNADHSGLITFDRKSNCVAESLEWCPDHEDCRLELLKNYPEKDFSWFIEKLFKGEVVSVGNTDDLPPQAENLKIALQKGPIKCFVAVPVSSKGRLTGILIMNFKKRNSIVVDDDTENMLRIPANLVADALIKIDSQKRINYLAYYDPLTELPNRALFNDRLEKAIALSVRNEMPVAVIMIDLDSFKNVNDTMGHDAGDLLLRQVAERLSGCIRQYDTMARFGGDEFLFILQELNNRDEAALIADKLITVLSEPIKLAGEEFFITASLGISIYPEDANDSDSLIKNSDLAMYVSKKHGKNRYTYYNSDMKENTHEKLKLTNELFRAVENEEFFLEYQPQVEAVSSRIIGLEALIRWQHPEEGLISPGVFIPLAEEVGLISKIGRWVLYTACRENKRLQEKGFEPVRVAVNLSVKQFNSGNLTQEVEDVLSQTGLSPECLELEVTESVAIGETYNIMDTLNELRALGITISIDDFGTEYSSLSRLKRLSIDRIKIDKQFIDGVSMNQDDESIINFIIELSKSLGVKVIAEGVENNLQLEYLKEKNCDEIQGFYFYKPLNLTDLETAMSSIKEYI